MALCSLLLISAAGCAQDKRGSTIGDITVKDASDSPMAVTDAMKAASGYSSAEISKAASFRSDVSDKGFRTAVYVYTSTYEKYSMQPETLAARLALLGFKDVFLSAPSVALLGTSEIGLSRRDWTRRFITAVHGYSMKAYAMRISDVNIFLDETLVDPEVSGVMDYNGGSTSTAHFDGIVADLEPQMMKSGQAPAGSKYIWNGTSGYGKDGQNDNLVKIAIDRLTRADRLMGSLELDEAYFCPLQQKYDLGLLNWGSVIQFLGCCNHVNLMAYSNTSDKILSYANPCLNSAKAGGYKKSIYITVKVAINTSGDNGDTSTSLQPSGWSGMLSTVKAVISAASLNASFRGMAFFQFDGFEQMLDAE